MLGSHWELSVGCKHSHNPVWHSSVYFGPVGGPAWSDWQALDSEVEAIRSLIPIAAAKGLNPEPGSKSCPDSEEPWKTKPSPSSQFFIGHTQKKESKPDICWYMDAFNENQQSLQLWVCSLNLKGFSAFIKLCNLLVDETLLSYALLPRNRSQWSHSEQTNIGLGCKRTKLRQAVQAPVVPNSLGLNGLI